MAEWQPIETAPKDGTLVLVYDPEGINPDDEVTERLGDRVLYVIPAYFGDGNELYQHNGWQSVMSEMDWGYYPGDAMFMQITVHPTHWMPLPDPPK